MIVRPHAENNFEIIPETEVEAFYVKKFLFHWQTGNGKITLRSGVMGNHPQLSLDLRAEPMEAIKLLPFIQKKKI